MPSPLAAVATTNATRTQITGTLRWRARPAATPPMTGFSESRVTRRQSRGGCVGVVVMTGQGSQSGTPHPMEKHPEPTLRPSPPGQAGFRVVPDGGQPQEAATLVP